MEHDERIKELTEFACTTAAVLADHKQVLERHEQNLQAEFRTAQSHRQAIEEMHSHLKSFAEVINQQSVLLGSLQETLLKVLRTMEPGSPEKIN